MGTAVLFPQDCLRPRSRLKNHAPGMIYSSESVSRLKRTRTASSSSLEAGLLPLPCHAQHTPPSRRGHDTKQSNARKAVDSSPGNFPPGAVASEVSVHRILQRSKQGAPSTPMVGASKATNAKGAHRSDMTAKAVTERHGENQDVCLPRLSRTSTEPAMIKHSSAQYTRRVVHISVGNSTSRQLRGSGRISSHEEERWAGPAYTSSPPPSSLPLPRLCLPQAKSAPMPMRSLVKQYSSGVYIQPFHESCAPTLVPSEDGGAWDVAFATRSLRRLLNLDA